MTISSCARQAGILLAGLACALPRVAAGEDRRVVSLNSHDLAPGGARAAALPASLRAPAGGEAGRYRIVKFPGPVTAAQLERLHADSERVYTYLPHDAFLVKTRPAETLAPAALGASWAEPYHPGFKISKFVAAVRAQDDRGDALRRTSRRMVMVHVYPDADLPRVAARMKALGAPVAGSKAGTFFSKVRLMLSAAEIVRLRAALARIPEVFWIEVEPRRVLLNDTTVWVGQSGLSAGQTTPIFDQGIFGEGQTIAVLDTGIDPDMCYFRDPSRGLPPRNECNGGTTVDNAQRKVTAVDFLWGSECSGGISGSEWDTQGHGTHVAGTAAGDNFASPLLHDPGDGMAPGAKLVIQDCGYQVNDCADCPGIGCPVVDLNPVFQQTYTQGARLHTNSWGDQENASPQNNYTSGSQDADEFMWNHKDFLIFFAAGNSGPGSASVGSPSTAKSVVSVGATLRGSSANSMASFSSCGPTDDGRIKPEVTVPGSGIISASNDGSITSNNCGTRSSSGTSMATPGAAGLTALIREYFAGGFYPSGTRVPANGFTPSAALMKATLVNSATQMANAGTIPANCQGWGRVLLENALYFDGQPRRLWVRDDASGFPGGSSGAERTFTFTVTAGQPFKATLAWTDFPSTPAANPHINNDLDLAVTGPGGTYQGNVFSSGQSTTGGSADRRNTLEQVYLASPAGGTYTVRVRSFTVPNGPQPFALVVTGAVTEGAGNVPPAANAGPDRSGPAGSSFTLDGTASSDPDGGPSPLSFAWTQVSGPSVTIGNANQATAGVTPSSAATYVFRLTVSDGAASDSDDMTVTATGGGPGDETAAFDSALQAPKCANLGRSCDTGPTLVLGRDNMSGGAETNQPNTISDSCADGGSGTFHSDESNDRIKVSTTDGSDFAPGKTVRIDASVWVWTTPSADHADFYYAANAASPSWTFIGTVTPTAAGAQTLSATYTLPSGSMQAVRVQFRYQGSASACTSGNYNDRDDLAFAVDDDGPPPGGTVFEDDFETAQGWTTNPSGTDTATLGLWERGDPQGTTSSGVTLQLNNTVSGVNCLVTEATAGSSAGVNDVDGGVTTIHSPQITLPGTGTLTLTFQYYLAHLTNATSADFFRAFVVSGSTSTQVFQSLGAGTNRAGAWTPVSVSLGSFAGQAVRLRFEAADASTGSLIEAGVDDVKITQQ